MSVPLPRIVGAWIVLLASGATAGVAPPAPLGTGDASAPYSIAQARALPAGFTNEYWAQGYIVGGRYDDFAAPFINDYGISIADSATEIDLNQCLQLKLETDGGRQTWGLATHPDNLGRFIRFRGYRDTYGNFPSFEGVDAADIFEYVIPATNLGFEIEESVWAENSGSVTVLVVRSSGAGSAAAQIRISGDAAPGSDYTLSFGETNLVFAPGATTAVFSVQLVDDGVVEDPETLVLDLVGIVGVEAGLYLQHTLTVEDDDAPDTPPTLQPVGNRTVLSGETLSFAVTAQATDGDPVTLTASNLPPGAIFSSDGPDGLFAWTNASPPGLYPVSFHAADKDGAVSVSASIEVTSDRLTFTLMAANLSAQSDSCETVIQDPAVRIFRGLAPDIVAIQEWNVTNAGGYRAFVDDTFGTGFAYYVEQESSCEMPNGIVSRWPIVASGEWPDSQVGNRDFAWATIDLPGGVDLHVVSVHLKADSDSASIRELQARALTNYMAQLPADDYIALAGDLNIHDPSEACYQILSAYLNDTRQPVDRVGDRDTNIPRNERYDYVLPNDRLNELHATCTVAGVSFPEGLVFESSQWSPPPFPVLSGDSTAPLIQHLAVMKAFTVGVSAGPGPVIDPVPDVRAVVGEDLAVTVSASSGDGSPVTLAAGHLPPGAVFLPAGASGFLVWSNAGPVGVYTAVIDAVNSSGATQASIRLDIAETALPLSLAGYVLYQTNSNQSFAFAPGTVLPPGGYLVIGRNADQAAFEAFWGVTLGANVTYINSGNKLPQLNGAEQFWITTPLGGILDGPTAVPMAVGTALVRVDAGQPATLSLNWQQIDESQATPGSGAALTGSGGLKITEISDASGTGDYIYEFVELVYDAAAPAPGSDADGDGLDDAWELDNFGSITNAGFATDADDDGFPDGHEFVAGTDPNDELSYLQVDELQTLAGSGAWSIRWLGATGRVYRVWSASWQPPRAVPVSSPVTASVPVTSVELITLPTNQAGYLYLEVE